VIASSVLSASCFPSLTGWFLRIAATERRARVDSGHIVGPLCPVRLAFNFDHEEAGFTAVSIRIRNSDMLATTPGRRLKRPRRFRGMLEQWLTTIRALWPECPASIGPDGPSMFVMHAPAVMPAQIDRI